MHNRKLEPHWACAVLGGAKLARKMPPFAKSRVPVPEAGQSCGARSCSPHLAQSAAGTAMLAGEEERHDEARRPSAYITQTGSAAERIAPRTGGAGAGGGGS